MDNHIPYAKQNCQFLDLGSIKPSGHFVGNTEHCFGKAEGSFPPPQTSQYTHTHMLSHIHTFIKEVSPPSHYGMQPPWGWDSAYYCTGLGSKHALQGSCALSIRRQGQASRFLRVEGLFLFWNPFYSTTFSGPGAGRGSRGTTWWMTWWSQPTVVRREWLSGDHVASLTKSLWARLLNLEQRGWKWGVIRDKTKTQVIRQKENLTCSGHIFWNISPLYSLITRQCKFNHPMQSKEMVGRARKWIYLSTTKQEIIAKMYTQVFLSVPFMLPKWFPTWSWNAS